MKCKEKETVKSLRPTVWLTEEFPLKIEEILPLLDILSNGVRAVRRLRELLTNKFPPGTFPVKVTIISSRGLSNNLFILEEFHWSEASVIKLKSLYM